MSTFATPVVRVLSVEDHPNADRLSIVKVLGYTCISGKLEDGSHRYKTDDLVVYIPTAAVVPEWLLKDGGYWNEETGKGLLNGPDGNRVGPRRLRGIYSEGILYPIIDNRLGPKSDKELAIIKYLTTDNGTRTFIPDFTSPLVGTDFSDLLGITKYEPPIPTNMAGEVANLSGHTVKYDFERLESVPDMFDPGETVVATEKLHGTFCAIGYIPNLNHPEMFGTDGSMIVHSKGLGGAGLAFKNNDANVGNLYVKTLRKLLKDNDLEAKLKEVSKAHGDRSVFIMGEIFGKGVQDLHYGTTEPEFRLFEVKVGNEYLPRDPIGFGHLDSACNVGGGTLGLDAAPLLYHGPFNVDELSKIRDGKTTLGGGNVREGIVIRSSPEGLHDYHGRKVAKMISPDYLLRKAKDQTEYT